MAYIGLNNGYTYGVKTLTQITSIAGMQTGDTSFCTTNNRVMTYNGSFWICDDFIIVVNRSGVTLNQWDVVVAQQGGTANEKACTRIATAGSPLVLGVVVYSATNGSNCVIAIKGNYQINVQGVVSLGADLTTSATLGRAQTNAGLFSEGVFAFATSSSAGGSATINCILLARKELN